MSNIRKSLIELVGNTPLVELCNFNKNHHLNAKIIAKIESFNPLGSSKDRVAVNMIEKALADKKINQNTVIIEPTSGNTGIGLCFVAAIKNMKLILTMPETMSIERINLAKALGATVILTDGKKGMSGAIEYANKLASETENSFIPQQFENPANPLAHKNTTALEILRDMRESNENIDAFVAGVGTGGTITGVGEVLKSEIPNVKIVAVEPFDSAVLSGEKSGSHKLQGIGAGFIPKIMNINCLDEIIKVKNEDAFAMAREVAKT
ncbi:MAG: pyridoxal-phosphate dependent enzyme, partial [Oscillospiraceae bacterium]